MPIFDRLERKLGWLAIPGIVRYLAGFQLLTWVLVRLNEGLLEALVFFPPDVIHGLEVWRLFTFVFIPPQSELFLIIALMFMWFLGEMLEARWGSLRLTLYVLGHIAGVVAGGFLVYFLAPDRLGHFNFEVIRNAMLVTSMLLAVGSLYPDVQINFMLVIPIKIMWLALFRGGILVLTLIQMVFSGELVLAAGFLMAIANYLVAFGPSTLRAVRQRGEVAARRRQFEAAKVPEDESLHRCATCGRTEHDDPDLDFRVAADGEEYCVDHLPGRSG